MSVRQTSLVYMSAGYKISLLHNVSCPIYLNYSTNLYRSSKFNLVDAPSMCVDLAFSQAYAAHAYNVFHVFCHTFVVIKSITTNFLAMCSALQSPMDQSSYTLQEYKSLTVLHQRLIHLVPVPSRTGSATTLLRGNYHPS